MKKFLIRLVGWILCLAIIAGGGYLTYITSDFEAIEADIAVIMAHLGAMGDIFGGGETSTPDEGGETSTPDEGGETVTPEEGGGSVIPDEGGEPVNPEN